MSKASAKKPVVATRVVERLQDASSPWVQQGAALLVDALLDRPLGDLVDLDEGVQIVRAALTAPNLQRAHERHLEPGRLRAREHAVATGDTPGAWLDPALRARLETLVREAPAPRAKWAKDVVEPAQIRRLVAPALQEMLIGFAQKLPIPGAKHDEPAKEAPRDTSRLPKFGIRDLVRHTELGRRAEGVIDRGRSIVGGLSAEVEARMQTAAKEFSQTAGDELRAALAERLKSDEGKQLLDQMRMSVLNRVLATTVADLTADLEYQDLPAIHAFVQDLIVARRDDPRVDAFVDAVIRPGFAAEAARTPRELLVEAGLLDTVHPMLLARTAQSIAWTATAPAFATWVESLLAD